MLDYDNRLRQTDKASMLDEVIEYLKQLQAQVQFMSVRSMQQMIMPIGMQQQLQMSLLARMGMGVGLGMGMGMLDMSSMARPAPQSLPLIHPTSVPTTPPAFVPPHFLLPPAIPRQDPTQAKPATNDSVDPFCAFLAQVCDIWIFKPFLFFLFFFLLLICDDLISGADNEYGYLQQNGSFLSPAS